MLLLMVVFILVGNGIQLQALNHLREPRPRRWFLRPDLYWNRSLYTPRGQQMWTIAFICYGAAIASLILFSLFAR